MDLILIGGLWLDDRAWDPVLPLLAERGHRGAPVSLPASADATLDDAVAAVLAAVDAADAPVVVGHSAACSLAWIAADARPDDVAKVALIGGFPEEDGAAYAGFFPLQDGVMRFPGWEPFAGPDSDDLTEEQKADITAREVPVPGGVANGVVRLTDERRFDVPVVLVCPEFSPEQARGWIDNGDTAELGKVRDLTLVDLDTGHWPMWSDPAALADVLADLDTGHWPMWSDPAALADVLADL